MKPAVIGFLAAARNAGMRISVAEGIDAFRALDAVGYDDRATMRDTLGLVLAKTADEQAIFEESFDLYFSRDGFHPQPDTSPPEGAPTPAHATPASLLEMLQRGDYGGMSAAMERAAGAAGVAQIRLFTQTNLFVQRILEQMGIEAVDREIARLRREGAGDAAERLERARAYLRERVRDLVERRLALRARSDARWRDEYLKTAKLWSIDRKDFDRVCALVRRIAKQLATRYGRDRRRYRRGALDVRRTLRHNMAYDAIPFVTAWKRRKIQRPRVLVLCDVSGSVAAVAQFLLLFLYSLSELLSDIRAFAFSSNLIEVSEILERETIESAAATIVRTIGMRSTDYGRSLEDFTAGWLRYVDNTTSIIIMGDARNNYGNPRVDLMRTLYERARRVIWLNPESTSSWGTGDSEMLSYLPYCHIARVCRSVGDLESIVGDLLRRAG